MPKPTKRSQLEDVQRLLAEAAYKLSEEASDWEGGYTALQSARAIIADLNGDIDGARSARRYVAHMSELSRASSVPFDQIMRRADANSH